MKEDARQERNADYLQELHPVIRRKAIAVIADLEQHGFRPRIQDAFRTQAEQDKHLAEGTTTVKWSYHMAKDKNGDPEALAFDLVEDDLLYSSVKFFMMCAMSGAAHGLNSGIFFGLSPTQKTALRKAMADRNFSQRNIIGWDGGHLEVSGITLAEAKKGKRPE